MKTQVNHLPVRHRTLNLVLTSALSLMTVFAIVFVVKTYQRSNYLSHFSIPVRTVTETASPMAILNLPEVVVVGHNSKSVIAESGYLPVMSIPEIVVYGLHSNTKNTKAPESLITAMPATLEYLTPELNSTEEIPVKQRIITAMPAVYEYLNPSTNNDELAPAKQRLINAMPAVYEYLTPESTEFAEDVIPLESWMYSPVEWSKSVQLAGSTAIDTVKTLAN